MPNLIDVVVSLSEIFDRLQLQYAIGGALANNYWGVVRATEDVDCLISLPAIKYQLFADEIEARGCTLSDEQGQDIPITAIALREQSLKRHLIEITFPAAADRVRVELFLPAVPLQHEILRRAVRLRLGEREVPITTAEDLILLKLVFHRIKDLQDVRGILWVQRGRLDLDYLKRWSLQSHEVTIQKELEQLIAEYCRAE